MATNEIYRDADSVPYPVAETVSSGDLVIFPSGLVGVAEVDAKPNEAGNGFVATIRTKGIWAFDMGTGAVGNGVAIYNSAALGTNVGVTAALTLTATDNEKVGTVYRGKPNAAGKVYIRIGG